MHRESPLPSCHALEGHGDICGDIHLMGQNEQGRASQHEAVTNGCPWLLQCPHLIIYFFADLLLILSFNILSYISCRCTAQCVSVYIIYEMLPPKLV